ncbi:right-handed parallel beta-helix repeat-containing protein [Pseudobacteriovorax antillogorgiicola]|uniref:Right handed beta helix region n=1 Tax=Pseudobacteriovorax antillogorgiicola TaxID=1513793 RepID=A0A1Y6BVH8_9BACT|nr:right-handed parallel beta-helix repeat-containing protein [Pseudobacteriovorax antillogorgiicola]TCS52276.1 hypothetical protein EDD56_10920 [Pseudobacteriovorax antillogorgiicola]SMF30743.1 hypothetical protein SAMN06296036_109193 [Pseudobacteriovorax antillogorgiicola]
MLRKALLAILGVATFGLSSCHQLEIQSSQSESSEPSEASAEDSPVVSEPVSVGGAFLIDCGPDDAPGEELIIGCRSLAPERALQADLIEASYEDQNGVLNKVASIPSRNRFWQLSFLLPQGARRFNIASLSPEDGTTEGLFTEEIPAIINQSFIEASCIAEDPRPCFTSLAAWQSNWGGLNFGNCPLGDLVCLERPALVQIRGPWETADRSPLTIDGWQTNQQFNIRIQATGEARHDGFRKERAYLMSPETGHGIVILTPYTVIDGLSFGQFEGDSREGIRIAATGVTIGNVLMFGMSGAHQDGIYVNGSNIVTHIYNSIFYGMGRSGIMVQGFPNPVENTRVIVSNVTAIQTCNSEVTRTGAFAGRFSAIGMDNAFTYPGSELVILNSIGDTAAGCTGFSFATTDSPSSNFNLATDGTAPGPNSSSNLVLSDRSNPSAEAGITFESLEPGQENLHLVSGSEKVGSDATSFFADSSLKPIQLMSQWVIGASP